VSINFVIGLIGDGPNNSFEYDYGNTKLIKSLKSILEHRNYFDINFLPFGVIQKLYKWHIDINGLIPEGLALDKTKYLK